MNDSHPSSEAGFTLVEFIIIVVVVGILASVAVIKFRIMSDEAEATICKSNQLSLRTAQTLFYINSSIETGNGTYTTSLEDIRPLLNHADQLECPTGGTYRLTIDGEAFCTLVIHQ